MIIAVIRMSNERTSPLDIDLMWITFWHQVEASTAVIMVCFTAFRSFFVARESRVREDRNRRLHWYMNRKHQATAAAKRWIGLRSDSREEINGLPNIPRATMTGMDTFIRGERTETTITV